MGSLGAPQEREHRELALGTEGPGLGEGGGGLQGAQGRSSQPPCALWWEVPGRFHAGPTLSGFGSPTPSGFSGEAGRTWRGVEVQGSLVVWRQRAWGPVWGSF